MSSLPKPGAAPSSHERILTAAKQLFAKRGYENTSTVAIARQAGTSESQLMKHFGSKEGLLEAIFERGWQAMGYSLGDAARRPDPRERLRGLLEVVLNGFERDAELKELMLLEGRRIRKEGHMIMMTSGFLEFVRMIDSLLKQLHDDGRLKDGVNPQAMRSAMIGMFEGLLRDQLLADRVGYPAHYSFDEIRHTFDLSLQC